MSSILRDPKLIAKSLLLMICCLLATGCGEEQAAAPPPPIDVEVVTVEPKDVPVYSEWVTTLDGYINAQIRPQVSGYLLKRNYAEGTMVARGAVLFEIDARPFLAALEQAKGKKAETEAQLGKATLDVARDTPLARAKAIPQAQLDNDIQAKAAAQAMVDAAQAQVAEAEFNVEFTKVRSLVNGIAGMAEGQIGDLVGPPTVLTTVSQVDPIKAYFSISEQEYMKASALISLTTMGKQVVTEKNKSLDLVLADGSVFAQKGWFVLADRQVDPKTGTVRIAGAFRNPGNILRPGQFGRVRIVTRVAKGALLVPQRAVGEVQGSYQVAVVGADKRAAIRPVKIGERIGPMWIIADGLQAGEMVIAEGVQKVRPGAAVNPKPFGAAAGSK